MGRKNTTLAANKITGDVFENIFIRRAVNNGLLPDKNYWTAKYGWGGRLKVVKSELDFKLISRTGQVGYFDCKTYAGASFKYSELDAHQVDRAFLFNEWHVPAGFVVWFRQANAVVFFSGYRIRSKGPGTSFGALDGRILGTVQDFDLRRVLEPITSVFQLMS